MIEQSWKQCDKRRNCSEAIRCRGVRNVYMREKVKILILFHMKTTFEKKSPFSHYFWTLADNLYFKYRHFHILSTKCFKGICWRFVITTLIYNFFLDDFKPFSSRRLFKTLCLKKKTTFFLSNKVLLGLKLYSKVHFPSSQVFW